ncbi:Hyalin [Micromonospora sp. L5]|nr:Hyalin [Micromonospora sp. L5]
MLMPKLRRMRIGPYLSAFVLAVTALATVGSPAAAAPSDADYITQGFSFSSREEARKHMPELRRRVAENADKPRQQAEQQIDTPEDAIQRAKEATDDYSVEGSSLLPAVAPLGNEDWATLDECRAVHDDDFDNKYFHKNKFSSCYSDDWAFPILERGTGAPIADVQFLLTYVIRGYNGQRYADVQVQLTDWDVDVKNAARWATIAPGLAYRLSPNCVSLDSGSSCGEPSPPYIQVLYGQSVAESLFYIPTTTTPWSGDTNPQDKKGYYAFAPDLLGTHLSGMVSDSHNPLPKDDMRCDSASYGNSLGSGGCLFTQTRSHITLSCSPSQGMTESTCFIKDAFEDITRTYPGAIGTYVPGDEFGSNGPLHRNYHQRDYWGHGEVNNTARDRVRTMCRQGYGANYTSLRTDGLTNDCDEFPFLKTYENEASLFPGPARAVAVRPVLSSHNQEAGNRLNLYYASDRLLDGDPFYVAIVDRGYCEGLQIPLPLPGGGFGGGTGGQGGGETGGGNTIPTISAAPVTLEANTTGGYSGPIPGVAATDADGDTVTLTNNAPALLPLGVTTVAWVARDPSGNRTTVAQQVTVRDSTPPTITCPDDATYRVLNPSIGTASARDVADPNPSVNSNQPALFHLGETTVKWTATDDSGNSASCDQKVRIIYAPPVAAGKGHSLAVNDDDTVSAWGDNLLGQLGNGSIFSETTAVPVSGLSGILAVSSGDASSYALTRSGVVHSWGENLLGQLGNGSRLQSRRPVQVDGLTGAKQIAAGNDHVLALKSDGTVAAWGSNLAGQLGRTGVLSATKPAAVPGLTSVVQVAAGGTPGLAGHSVALKGDGTVWTWGHGLNGQLGLGDHRSTATPTQVPGLSNVVLIAADGNNTYALKSDGTVWAWGDGNHGQIGNPDATHSQTTPLKVNISGVVSIDAGSTTAMAVKGDGTVWGWGSNASGQLGDDRDCGLHCSTPVKASGLTGAGWIASGLLHSLVVNTDGNVHGYGGNLLGQLGNGTRKGATTPTTVSGVTAVHR